MKSNTIVAISTAPGIGGIGIIRMSGEDSYNIISKIFKPYNDKNIDVKGYTIKYGYILDNSNNVVDEVLVSFFKSPKSYTTEDMVEISSHGGSVIMNKILDICLKNGAELAEPGEFTKRAFLNGRIDLSQAEAVIDVINSKTDKEADVSIKQLEGSLSSRIEFIRKKIISMMADIEASIDYPEYDIEETTNDQIKRVLKEIDVDLEKLENSFNSGKILRDGIKVAIIGRPNAGKSSLLNRLLKEDRAIVTNIEGTTRDTIEEFIQVKGIPIKVIDTAGIRNAKDEVESIGVKKAVEIAKDSDIVIAIFDSSRVLSDEDKNIIDLIKDKNAIILLNKIDLDERKTSKEDFIQLNKKIIETSMKEEIGIEEIYDEIFKMFNINDFTTNDDVIVSNLRHKNIIINTRKNLQEVINTMENNMPIDIISGNLREMLDELGKITGETVTEDLLNEIFSKFCLGK